VRAPSGASLDLPSRCSSVGTVVTMSLFAADVRINLPLWSCHK
jgi:hypothetical protein